MKIHLNLLLTIPGLESPLVAGFGHCYLILARLITSDFWTSNKPLYCRLAADAHRVQWFEKSVCFKDFP